MRVYVVLQHIVNYVLNHSVKIHVQFLCLIYKNLDQLTCFC